jgi:predicted ArsR family transcriptional regulator
MSDIVVNAAGLRIVKLLVGNPPQTIANLARTAGVTRTAVVEQLDELLAAGFVARETERLPSRGRPHHLYRATQTALALLLPGNQSVVVPALWQAIHDVGGEELVKKIVKRAGRALAEHYNSKITAKKPHERLRQLVALMTEEGGLVDGAPDGKRKGVLRKRSCPFISMVDPQRAICQVDLEMLSTVVGRPVRQTACRHEGDPSCVFEIVGE